MKRTLACLLLTALATNATQACDGHRDFAAYGFPWFGYGNQGPAAYALGNIPAPPYFALHPPVYYSHPVARPYGHSPFACSGSCHHPIQAPARRMIVNPMIEVLPSEKAAPTSEMKVTATPSRIVNPYFAPQAAAERGLVSN